MHSSLSIPNCSIPNSSINDDSIPLVPALLNRKRKHAQDRGIGDLAQSAIPVEPRIHQTRLRARISRRPDSPAISVSSIMPSKIQEAEAKQPITIRDMSTDHELNRALKRSSLVRHHSAPHLSSGSKLPFSLPEKAASQLMGETKNSLELKLKGRQGISSSTEISERNLLDMIQNSKQAIAEHRKKEDACIESAYAPLPDIKEISPQLKLSFAHQIAERRGTRSFMEDASLCEPIPGGTLAGVFDGHGGSLVSNFACQYFASFFCEAREQAQGDIYEAFIMTIDRIHRAVATNPEMKLMGSTLAVSFIKDNGTIYTATVGDSEVFAYDTDESGSLKSTPLSLVRDWGSSEEIRRAIRLAPTKKEAEERMEWHRLSNPKKRRVRRRPQNGRHTLNLSRAIGDPGYLEVSKTPKITIAQLGPQSKIGFFCDGVTDVVSQREIIDLITRVPPGCDLAGAIADYALDSKSSKDNVTAIFLYGRSC